MPYAMKTVHFAMWTTAMSCLCGLAIPTRAEVGPTPGSYRIAPLFDSADAVCVGTVLGSEDLGVGTEPSGLKLVSRGLRFSPARCYKGQIALTDEMRFRTHVPPARITDRSLKVGDAGLVFVKRIDDKTLEFTDPFWGWLYDASLTRLSPQRGTGTRQLEADVLLNVREARTPNARVGNLRVLHGFDQLSPETIEAVREYTRDGDARVAVGAFSILAKAGRPDDMANLCEYVVGGGDAVAAAVQEHSFTAIAKLTDPSTRVALECLARTSVIPLKRSAMDAIRGMGDPSSVPELVRHLDDPEPVMQHLALMALSEIVRRPGETVPLLPTFLQDPARYVAPWKRWWSESGREQYERSQH